jgi:isocitrate/isopropylmalate dehydrogenase
MITFPLNGGKVRMGRQAHAQKPQSIRLTRGPTGATSLQNFPTDKKEMGMKFLIMPGDGIGPEIVPVAVAALKALDRKLGLNIALEEVPIGFASLETAGNTFPDEALAKARESDGVIMGPTDTLAYPPLVEGGRGPSAFMRTGLDLYANIRPAKTRPGVPSAVANMDLVFARENTEGFYADRSMHLGNGEMMVTEDVAIAVRKITREASRKIAEAAFKLALQRRKKVTIVTKRNVLKMTDGLFYDTVREVGKSYPGVEIDDVIIDAMSALMVRTPEAFDVVCTSNMYGDILSDLGNELAGGLGLGGTINAGDTHVMAQCVHGSAPDIEGRDIANPTAMVLSLAMMLDWIAAREQDNKLKEAGHLLNVALDAQLADPSTCTRDLGGPIGCKAFGQALVKRLED